MAWTVGGFSVILLLVWMRSSLGNAPYATSEPSVPGHRAHSVLAKPSGFEVIGLVFYGRKETVSILDCYLKACAPSLRYSRILLTGR